MRQPEGTHLAQLNLGRLAYDLDDPRVGDFVNGLDMVNRIAAASPGFVWKYETGVGGAVEDVVDGDARILVNMTVWESVEALRHFAFQTLHKRFFQRRGEWFAPLGRPGFVMWWVERGHRPTLAEALGRLERLRASGPSPGAFDWSLCPPATGRSDAPARAALSSKARGL